MLCFGAEESGFNRNLLLSKSKPSTWISLVQEVLFILLATNHFHGSAYLHDILENTTTDSLAQWTHNSESEVQGKEDKTTGKLVGCYYLKENK